MIVQCPLYKRKINTKRVAYGHKTFMNVESSCCCSTSTPSKGKETKQQQQQQLHDHYILTAEKAPQNHQAGGVQARQQQLES
jgi:hypothetical protein